jgi:hypothetical protein
MVFMECLKRYSTRSKFPGVGRNYPPLPPIKKNGSLFFPLFPCGPHLLFPVPLARISSPTRSCPTDRRRASPSRAARGRRRHLPLPRRARPSRARPPSLTSRWCPLAPVPVRRQLLPYQCDADDLPVQARSRAAGAPPFLAPAPLPLLRRRSLPLPLWRLRRGRAPPR